VVVSVVNVVLLVDLVANVDRLVEIANVNRLEIVTVAVKEVLLEVIAVETVVDSLEEDLALVEVQDQEEIRTDLNN
jgi:hypothetical protein